MSLSKYFDNVIIIAFIFSLACHAAVLFLIPAMEVDPLRGTKELLEITFMPRSFEDQVVQINRTEEEQAEVSAGQTNAGEDISAKGESDRLPDPLMELPSRLSRLRPEMSFSIPVESDEERTLTADRLRSLEKEFGIREGVEKGTVFEPVKPEKFAAPGRPDPNLFDDAESKIPDWDVPQKRETRRAIEGPAGERKILYQPDPPEVNVRLETSITLKFWVLPDGTVGRIVPQQKGDAHLERIAIEYLKKWLFEPINIDEDGDQEVWGIIDVHFKLT